MYFFCKNGSLYEDDDVGVSLRDGAKNVSSTTTMGQDALSIFETTTC